MKLGTVGLLVILLALVGGIYYMYTNGGTAAPAHTDGVAGPAMAQFMGKTLNVPEGWSVYEFGTRGGTLSLTRHADQGLSPTLTLDDERKAPEDPAKFVAGWKTSLRVSGLHPQSLDEFHDSAVDAAGARCVAIEWGGTQRPYRLICLASNGRWKLTLSGNDSDVAAMDEMARQLPSFVRGL